MSVSQTEVAIHSVVVKSKSLLLDPNHIKTDSTHWQGYITIGVKVVIQTHPGKRYMAKFNCSRCIKGFLGWIRRMFLTEKHISMHIFIWKWW